MTWTSLKDGDEPQELGLRTTKQATPVMDEGPSRPEEVWGAGTLDGGGDGAELAQGHPPVSESSQVKERSSPTHLPQGPGRKTLGGRQKTEPWDGQWVADGGEEEELGAQPQGFL